MKRHKEMATGNVCSARDAAKIKVKLRTRNQPTYGPPIPVRTLRYGTHGRDRAGRKYLKHSNLGTTLPGHSINPVLLLGAQIVRAMAAVFAGGHAFMAARKAAAQRGR